MPGPVAKRSSQRRRRNKDSEGVDVVPMAGERVKPPAEDRAWHPIAKGWYRSLKQSGQAQFFEPSDWQAARLCAHVMTEHLKSKSLRAGMVHELWAMMGDLLTTEASRRRVRIELARKGSGEDDDAEATVTMMQAYRDELGG